MRTCRLWPLFATLVQCHNLGMRLKIRLDPRRLSYGLTVQNDPMLRARDSRGRAKVGLLSARHRLSNGECGVLDKFQARVGGDLYTRLSKDDTTSRSLTPLWPPKH